MESWSFSSTFCEMYAKSFVPRQMFPQTKYFNSVLTTKKKLPTTTMKIASTFECYADVRRTRVIEE